MKKKIGLLFISACFLFVTNVSFGQSFFKALPRHVQVTHTNAVGARITPTDSIFIAFRPIANIAAMSFPSFEVMAGAGIGFQNLDYNYATGHYYCNWSINAVMFAGGTVAPNKPTPALTYGLMVGFLNNVIMIGPGINDGKLQGIVSVGINFNN